MKTKQTKIKKNFNNYLLGILLLINYFSFAQDTCSTALPIIAGSYTVTSINGTQVPSPVCSSTEIGATAGEWYSYTPTQNYSLTVTTDLVQNICRDTRFQVYTGNCSGLVCYSGNDDAGEILCTTNNLSYLSVKKFDVFAGTTYYIAFDNKWESNGFDFKLIESEYIPNPCNLAINLTAGTTIVSALEPNNINTSCATNRTLAKWYKYQPAQNLTVTVSSDLIANVCKDTNFSIYKGLCDALVCVATDDNSGIVECNSGGVTSNLSKKTFDVIGGTVYYIVWDNKNSNSGFEFTLSETPTFFPVIYSDQTIATIPVGQGKFNNCVVDMNNDQKDDIVGVSNNNIKIHFQTNNNQFSLANFPTTATSLLPNWSIAAGDYNKDGYNDLMYGNGNGVAFMKSNNTGTAYTNDTPGQYIFCQRTNFVDINNDGNLDAFSCHDIQPNVYYINDGSGNFSYNQSGVTPGAYNLGVLPSGGNYASIWTDYDNDGDLDMFISKCSGPASELHRNDGNGVFTDISALTKIDFLPVQSWSSAIDDFDNDGDMDIMVGTNGFAENKLFRNDLDKTNSVEEQFADVTIGSGFDENLTANRDYVSYDFDNDGKIDILGSGNKIMFNKGNNVFKPSYYQAIEVGAIGDLNNDGFLDIQNNDNVKFAIPNGNNWIKIAYKGIQSNRNGIGARIEIYGSWGKQIRDVRSGEGFEFMSSLNTHFGLGTATAIDKIIVKWPSGKVDEILNLAINQTLLVVEGATNLANKNFDLTNLRISPNPVIDQLQFSFDNNLNDTISTEVVDVTGKIVLKPSINSNSIDVKQLTAGFYFLVLKSKNSKQIISKFIKK